MAERGWFIIRVELVGRIDEELHPPPGRDFLASGDVDPEVEFGDEPLAPVPIFGWGDVPDQYGRSTPDD